MRHRVRAGLLAFGTAIMLTFGWTASPALAGLSTGATPERDVVAYQVRPDGTGQIDRWIPAAGVSSQQLYSSLKAQGVTGLVDPASRSQIDEVLCTINGAWALDQRCGTQRFHWAGTHPRVHIMDHTGPGWPVHTKADKWNTSPAIDTIYHWYSQYNCTSNCVWVSDGNYGPTWVAHTQHYTNGGLVLTGAVVDFNDYCASGYPCGNARWMAETTCHELGHVLGLDHNTFQSSCVYYVHTSSRSDQPGAGDYSMLDSIY